METDTLWATAVFCPAHMMNYLEAFSVISNLHNKCFCHRKKLMETRLSFIWVDLAASAARCLSLGIKQSVLKQSPAKNYLFSAARVTNKSAGAQWPSVCYLICVNTCCNDFVCESVSALEHTRALQVAECLELII